VIEAFAVLPSLVAVMVAVPEPTPVTTPALDTVAVPAAPVVQVTARPDRVFPDASFVVAVRMQLFAGLIVQLSGESTTLDTATGAGVVPPVPPLPVVVPVTVSPPPQLEERTTASTPPHCRTICRVRRIEIPE
jgi:hypothetical protein